MPESFDPYRQWLGIQVQGRPNHYRLMGLKPLEADAGRISQAAQSSMAKLQTVPAAERNEHWQRLVSEVAAATSILTDAAKKAAYDKELQRRAASAAAGSKIASRAGATGQPVATAKPIAKAKPIATARPIPSAEPEPAEVQMPNNPDDDLPPELPPEAGGVDELLPPGAAPPVMAADPHDPMRPMTGVAPGMPDPMGAVHNPMAPPAYGYGQPMGQPGYGMPQAHGTYGMPAAHGFPAPSPFQQETLSTSSDMAPVSLDRVMKRKRSVVPLVLGLVFMIAAGAALFVGYQRGMFGEKTEPETNEVAQADPDATKPHDDTNEDDEPTDTTPPAEKVEKEAFPDLPINQGSQGEMRPPREIRPQVMVEPVAPPSEKPEMMEEAEVKVPPELKKALAAVRTALGKRDMASATSLLTKAKALATTPELEEEVYRYELLLKYVDGFWKEVRQALAAVQPADELQVGSTVFSVTEATPTQLTIRVLGQLKTFKVIDDLPSGVAIALAQQRIDPMNPKNKVYYGAFQAVDPKGSMAEASRLWGEAALAGIDVDTLMPLAAVAPTGIEAELMMEQGEPPDAKATAAAEAALAASLAAVKKATLPTQRAKVAQALLEEALTNNEPAQKFVLLRNARDLAAMTDPILALQVCDEIAKNYKVDGLALKAAVLAKAPTRNAATAKETAEAAMTLVDEAVTARNFAVAERISTAALAAARKSQNIELLKQVNAKHKEVLAMKKQ